MTSTETQPGAGSSSGFGDGLRMRSRDLHAPRIRPGMRVRFDHGKWNCCANGVQHDPNWASRPWAMTQLGVTTDPSEFAGSIFPPNSPWGLPDYATPVRWDGAENLVWSGERVTWARTSCLDVIGDQRVIESGQQEMLFESPNAQGSGTPEDKR